MFLIRLHHQYFELFPLSMYGRGRALAVLRTCTLIWATDILIPALVSRRFFLSFIALEIAMLGKGKGAYDTVLRCAAVSSCPFLLVGCSTTGSVAWVLVPSPTLLFDLHS